MVDEARASYNVRASQARGRGRARNRGRARMARRAEREYDMEQTGDENPDNGCALCGTARCSCNGQSHTVNSDREEDVA